MQSANFSTPDPESPLQQQLDKLKESIENCIATSLPEQLSQSPAGCSCLPDFAARILRIRMHSPSLSYSLLHKRIANPRS